jgi:hypothetical protein
VCAVGGSGLGGPGPAHPSPAAGSSRAAGGGRPSPRPRGPRRIRAAARRTGRTPSAAALALAAGTIRSTNIPAALRSLPAALGLANVRWHIDLIVKRGKSSGLVDQGRTGKPTRMLCARSATLLGMVRQQWCCLVGCWASPDRALVQAAQVVRDHAVALAHARGCPARLAEALTTIQQVVRRTARMNSRATHPNTSQRLLAVTTEDAEPAASRAVQPPSVVDSPVRLPAQRALRCAAEPLNRLLDAHGIIAPAYPPRTRGIKGAGEGPLSGVGFLLSMDEFRIRARKMTNYTKEAFSASECALSKKSTLERRGAGGEGQNAHPNASNVEFAQMFCPPLKAATGGRPHILLTAETSAPASKLLPRVPCGGGSRASTSSPPAEPCASTGSAHSCASNRHGAPAPLTSGGLVRRRRSAANALFVALPAP